MFCKGYYCKGKFGKTIDSKASNDDVGNSGMPSKQALNISVLYLTFHDTCVTGDILLVHDVCGFHQPVPHPHDVTATVVRIPGNPQLCVVG